MARPIKALFTSLILLRALPAAAQTPPTQVEVCQGSRGRASLADVMNRLVAELRGDTTIGQDLHGLPTPARQILHDLSGVLSPANARLVGGRRQRGQPIMARLISDPTLGQRFTNIETAMVTAACTTNPRGRASLADVMNRLVAELKGDVTIGRDLHGLPTPARQILRELSGVLSPANARLVGGRRQSGTPIMDRLRVDATLNPRFARIETEMVTAACGCHNLPQLGISSVERVTMTGTTESLVVIYPNISRPGAADARTNESIVLRLHVTNLPASNREVNVRVDGPFRIERSADSDLNVVRVRLTPTANFNGTVTVTGESALSAQLHFAVPLTLRIVDPSPASCTDGRDNNHNDLIDAADLGCQPNTATGNIAGEPDTPAPTPRIVTQPVPWARRDDNASATVEITPGRNNTSPNGTIVPQALSPAADQFNPFMRLRGNLGSREHPIRLWRQGEHWSLQGSAATDISWFRPSGDDLYGRFGLAGQLQEQYTNGIFRAGLYINPEFSYSNYQFPNRYAFNGVDLRLPVGLQLGIELPTFRLSGFIEEMARWRAETGTPGFVTRGGGTVSFGTANRFGAEFAYQSGNIAVHTGIPSLGLEGSLQEDVHGFDGQLFFRGRYSWGRFEANVGGGRYEQGLRHPIWQGMAGLLFGHNAAGTFRFNLNYTDNPALYFGGNMWQGAGSWTFPSSWLGGRGDAFSIIIRGGSYSAGSQPAITDIGTGVGVDLIRLFTPAPTTPQTPGNDDNSGGTTLPAGYDRQIPLPEAIR